MMKQKLTEYYRKSSTCVLLYVMISQLPKEEVFALNNCITCSWDSFIVIAKNEQDLMSNIAMLGDLFPLMLYLIHSDEVEITPENLEKVVCNAFTIASESLANPEQQEDEEGKEAEDEEGAENEHGWEDDFGVSSAGATPNDSECSESDDDYAPIYPTSAMECPPPDCVPASPVVPTIIPSPIRPMMDSDSSGRRDSEVNTDTASTHAAISSLPSSGVSDECCHKDCVCKLSPDLVRGSRESMCVDLSMKKGNCFRLFFTCSECA